MWRNPQETADLVSFTEESLDGKFHFLCNARFDIILKIKMTIDYYHVNILSKAEAYSEPCQTSKIEIFAKIVNSLKPLTIFTEKLDLRCLTGISIRLCKETNGLISEFHLQSLVNIRNKFVSTKYTNQMIIGNVPIFLWDKTGAYIHKKHESVVLYIL